MPFAFDLSHSCRELSEQVKKGIVPLRNLNDLDDIIERIGNAKVVLLGECTHGTREFYEWRANLTEALIKQKGFQILGFEGDWPDMACINRYIHGTDQRADQITNQKWDAFARFPEWMWRNTSFASFIETLRGYNSKTSHGVSVYGLDLYSLSSSLEVVVRYLKKHDHEALEAVQSVERCLDPWRHDPSRYGLAVWHNQTERCREPLIQLVGLLSDSSVKRMDPEWLSVMQNAKALLSAEAYYRIMYEDSEKSWNLRDQHMFSTLQALLDHHGPESKIVIWEHNSHLGDARATQMSKRGELNVGQLCKQKFGDQCYSIGLMSDHGQVAAASQWDGPVEIKKLLPAREDSFEGAFHATGVPLFALPLRNEHQDADLLEALYPARLERAVGVLYLPQSERWSHYFHAHLSNQFDEVIWMDETRAVEPLPEIPILDERDTYPFGI